jgi:Protein of unknown function (DUF3592)
VTDVAKVSYNRRDRWIMIIMGGVFMLFGTGFAIGTVADWRRDTRLLANGDTTHAVVIRKDVVNDEGKQYYLAYEFAAANGARFNGRRRVTERWWQTIAVGDSIAVRYDAKDPRQNLPAGLGTPSLALMLFMAVFSTVFTGFGAFVLIAGIRSEPNTREPHLSPQSKRRERTRH